MSSIQLQGNSSGTGVMTVSSPNTNTNYTITLPQADTTLVGTDATQTLTNKTITGGTISSAASLDVTGNTTLTGYVGIGGATPGSNPKLSMYGGIRFLAAEAAANTYTGVGSIQSDAVSISCSGIERFRIGPGGGFGISGANYGSSGQALTSAGSDTAPTWTTLALFVVGQTLTNYTSSGRSIGTTYTNSTGKPIAVMMSPNASGGLITTAQIDGNTVAVVQNTPSGGGGTAPFFLMVPNGSTYAIINGSNTSIAYWYEWR
jgi:hypothetical protein